MRSYFVIFILIFVVVSCSDSEDSQVSGGEFTVHFKNTEDHELAKEIVHFWKADSLITGKPQDVRLVRTKKGYDLLMIAGEKKKESYLSFEELRALSELQKRLQEQVFKEDEVSLVITDEYFEELFRPSL